MLYFKSCPRCRTGTVQLENDIYGSYLSCLNCGFEKSAASVRKLVFEEIDREGELMAAVAAGTDESEDSPGTGLEDEEFFDADDEELRELERAVG